MEISLCQYGMLLVLDLFKPLYEMSKSLTNQDILKQTEWVKYFMICLKNLY